MSDLDATVAFAQASGHADTARLGIIGYCWGGRTVWLYGAHNPRLKAGVAYYGLLSGMKSDIKPNDPIDIGDAHNLHPTNKQDVGRRLARAARHVIYGESIVPPVSGNAIAKSWPSWIMPPTRNNTP